MKFPDPDHPELFHFGWQVDGVINKRDLSRAHRDCRKKICRNIELEGLVQGQRDLLWLMRIDVMTCQSATPDLV